MKKLEYKLKELQRKGYEFISIDEVLNLIYNIRMDNRSKKSK